MCQYIDGLEAQIFGSSSQDARGFELAHGALVEDLRGEEPEANAAVAAAMQAIGGGWVTFLLYEWLRDAQVPQETVLQSVFYAIRM